MSGFLKNSYSKIQTDDKFTTKEEHSTLLDMISSAGGLDLSNSTTFVGNVTASGVYMTLSFGGSAFKMELYQ